jgi:hypothetical protein
MVTDREQEVKIRVTKLMKRSFFMGMEFISSGITKTPGIF